MTLNSYKTFDIKFSKKNIDYSKALLFMEKRVQSISYNNKKEFIWFLNHNHIYTQGTSASNKEIIKTTNTPIIKTNRGGKTTYHGPGQRIVYLLIDLNKRKKDIRSFISLLENTVISLLKIHKIESVTHPDRVGIWVTKVRGNKLAKERKIGAIGLRIKKWITYHGLSFNINQNLSYYKNINDCGLKNNLSTSLKELGIDLTYKEFDKMFLNIFNEKLKQF